jgi:hypothetical protein
MAGEDFPAPSEEFVVTHFIIWVPDPLEKV